MKVEPRTPKGKGPQTFAGLTLKSIRVAGKEMILSFEKEGEQLHLICAPEGNLITPPDGGKPFVHVTGMKYETGTGELSILAEFAELAGEAVEILGLQVSNAHHDPISGVFGIQLGPEYGVVITPGGLKVLHTKELEVEFRKPLVIV